MTWVELAGAHAMRRRRSLHAPCTFPALQLLAIVTDPYPPKDVLNTLLAVQALLVAASTLAATVGRAPVEEVELKDYVPYQVARGIACLMVVVAVGGGAAWWQTFVSDPAGFDGIYDVLQAAGLGVPLVVIPWFGFKAAGWSKP